MVYEEGMRVVCIDIPDGNRKVLGKQGTVSHEEEDGWVTVEWDEDIDGWGDGDRRWSCPHETIAFADVENE